MSQPMPKPHTPRRSLPCLEPLEGKALLSLLITDRPTLAVAAVPHRVVPDRQGGLRVLGPATVQVFGSAQPSINVDVQVGLFAQDESGTILNNDEPLAVATPNELGRYAATVPLPAALAGQTIELIALEVASGTLTSDIAIPATTLRGLSGTVMLGGGVLFNLGGSLSLEPGMLTNLNATLTTSTGGLTGLTGGISNPGASLTLDNGTTGTVGASLSTLGAGSGTLSPLTGNLTGGTGTETARLGNFTGGRGSVSASSGQVAQNGIATIAGTSAQQSIPILEYAASDPITLHIASSPVHRHVGRLHRTRAGTR